MDKYESANRALELLFQNALYAGNVAEIENAAKELFDFINHAPRPPSSPINAPAPTGTSDGICSVFTEDSGT